MRWIEAGRFVMVSGLGWALGACSLLATGPTSEIHSMSLSVSARGVDAQTLAEARSDFDLGNMGMALMRVEAYLSQKPDSVGAHNLAGAIFDRIGRYDLAHNHYETALSLQADYLPAINNFGLSKLQRARMSARPDLAREADELLARAIELSGNPEQLAETHAAIRKRLDAQGPARQSAPIRPVRPYRTAWLERRGRNRTYVVTRPSSATLAEVMALDLDPAIALVSPGATFAVTRLSIAPRGRQLRAWASAPKAAPHFFGATAGLSRLTLNPRPLKPQWYRNLAGACDPTRMCPVPQPLTKMPREAPRWAFLGDVQWPANATLSARAATLLSKVSIR